MKKTNKLHSTHHNFNNANFANKVALFGGSFYPPHLAHLAIIKWLSTHFRQVVVIPSYQNPLKDATFVPIKMRLQWCKKMCLDFSNVLVSDIEEKHNKVMFAYDVARHFHAEFFTKNLTDSNTTTLKQDSKHIAKSNNSTLRDSKILDIVPPLYFVIGEDCLGELHKWKHIKSLSKLVEFIVFKRNIDNVLDFTQMTDFARISFVDFVPNDCLKISLKYLPSNNLSSSFIKESFLQKSNHNNMLATPLANNQANDTHKQMLDFIPECLHDEVLAFFHKTSLQFD